MRYWRKLAYLIILAAIFTTSCWNSRELNDLGLVTGIAIDVGPEEGTINLTSQVIKPAKIKTGAEQSSESQPYFNITSTGKTIFEAIRKSSRLIDRRLYFPHSQILIVSEDVAKEGVLQYLDLLIRDPEFRRDSFILVSKGKAADALSAKTELEDIPGSSIYHLVQRRTGASLASGVTFLEFTQRLMSKTTAPIASNLEFHPDTKKLTLTGTSVFKKDKLAGYLNETETRGLLWASGEVRAGLIIVKCPDQESNVTLEIVSATGKINPQIKGDELQLEIKIGVQVHLAEQACPGDLTTEKNSAFLKKELVAVIKKEITAALNKARDLNCDIFAFGSEINKKFPKLWRDLEQDWEEQFATMNVVISVEPVLTRSGMTTKATGPKQ